MNVLFLSPDFVLPAERGVRVRILSQMRVLSGMSDVEHMTVLSLSESDAPAKRILELEGLLPKTKVKAPIVRSSRIRSSVKNVVRFFRRRVLQGMPYITIVCDDPAMHDLVQQQLGSERYDAVYLGNLGMMAYAADVRRLCPRARIIVEQHNVEWQVFDRLADSFRSPLKQVTRWEARATRRLECESMRAADAVIAISEADAKGFREMAGVEAVVVPPFVPVGEPRVETECGPRLGYIGLLGWQPNAYGLDWFCRDVWHHIVAKVPDVSLTIAGSGLRMRDDGSLNVPSAWQKPGIKTVGFVEDLEDLYCDVVAMIAPVVGGSGVRMKLLETMSAGMPTVTTTDGAAGLGVTDGVELLVADSPVEFAEKVALILSDEALRTRLRAGGYQYLEERHSLRAAEARVRRALMGP